MELLQNRRYKPGEISASYYHEIKAQIESLVDVCREGEVSVHEAENIILEELFCSKDYLWNLCELLDNFDSIIENDYTLSPEGYKILGFNAAYDDFIQKDIEEMRDKMSDYGVFVAGAYDRLIKILKNTDYLEKRKAKINQQIIRDGLPVSLKNEDNTTDGASPKNITDYSNKKSFRASLEKHFEEEKVKNNVDSNGDQQRQPERETPAPENKILPPVIQDILKEGLLNDTPTNGKYTKRKGKKDTDIIKWVFDNYPIYADTLTPDLYMKYIYTDVLPQTIGQYMSRANTEAK
jgi:hypothetical protein